MGGRSTSTSATKLNGIAVQSSVLGVPITVGWGRTRIKGNLLWYGAFTPIPKTTKTGGKGGGSTNTTYSYTASIIMGLAEGPITGVRSVYRDKSVFTDGGTTALAQAGLSLAAGALGQATWGYLTSLFPAQAIGYSGIAYVYAQDYPLSETATLSNHSFEVDFATQLPGLADADPKDIITGALTNPNYGVPGWGAGLLGDLSDFSLWCRANNLLMSPALESQVSAREFLDSVCEAANSAPFWSEGVLKVRPYGDTAATANGVTWTPSLTPIYDLTEDDFEDLSLEIVDQADAYNMVQIEYLDRANQYNPAIEPADDLANVVQYGLRKEDPTEWHMFCVAAIARTAAQMRLQRKLYERDIYRFTLPRDYILLEPMDYVSLTSTTDQLQLYRQLVRITSIDEGEDGRLSCEATGVLQGTGAAALYPSHSASGFQPNADAAPGNVSAPLIFNAPTSLVTNGPEVWCAVAGLGADWGGCNVWISLDNLTYTSLGPIAGPARYGVLSATLATGTDPDTANTLKVNLSTSKGVLNDATTAEADAGASMCWVGGELISYRDATLTAANQYDLTYLRRGQRGTAIAARASGTGFARLDDAIFKFAYPTANVGATIYIKFQSYNAYGRALQDLATLTAYTISLTPASALPDPVTGLALAGTGGTTWTGTQISVVCNPSDRATSYDFKFYKSDGTTLLRTITSVLPMAVYTADMAAIDGPQRNYVIRAIASNAAGATQPSTSITVGNTAPATVTGVTTSGGSTTATISWTASTDADLYGYVVFFSTTSGFDPRTEGSLERCVGNTVTLYGLAAGTYYARVAARDPWTDAPTLLNLTSEVSFTISTGGGAGAPSGGGGAGGYNSRFGDGTQIRL